MRYRDVLQEEIDEHYIEFCKDLGVSCSTKEEIEKYIKEQNIIIEKQEDVHLIWFEQIENGEIKYYSKPIKKYISEPKNELRIYIKSSGPIGVLHMPESAIPIYNFNQKRKGKIAPSEIQRTEKNNQIKMVQEYIDSAFSHSIFGYILFDGKQILIPRTNNIFEFNYEQLATYLDIGLVNEVLSDTNKYTWYKENNKNFIVENSPKNEYQYLDETTKKIKLAKFIDGKLVLVDIIKDEQTQKIEQEIDDCIAQSEAVHITPYIRFKGKCFEIIKTKYVPIIQNDENFDFFPNQEYRKECSYKKIETTFNYDQIVKVVKSGNKYKWYEYHGCLYITKTFGKSNLKIVVGNYIKDFTDAVDCLFKYNNSPFDMVIDFIKNGIFDVNTIIKKYKCSMARVNGIIKELVSDEILEEVEYGSNQYKFIENKEDLLLITHCIERKLNL